MPEPPGEPRSGRDLLHQAASSPHNSLANPEQNPPERASASRSGQAIQSERASHSLDESHLRNFAKTTWDDVVCPGCGCLCDDLRVSMHGSRVAQVANACPVGERLFRQVTIGGPEDSSPSSWVDGQPTTYQQAVSRAIELLGAAQAPLIGGFDRTTAEAVRQATRLADRLRGTILGSSHSGSLSFRGGVRCTLGEIRHRADQLLIWGADPWSTHPRYFTRHGVNPAGRFVPTGRQGRTLTVVDTQQTATTAEADDVFLISPGSDFESLVILQAILASRWVDEVRIEQLTGQPRDAWQRLAERLKSASYGVLVAGAPLWSAADLATQRALAQLIASLNRSTRFALSPLVDPVERGCCNSTGVTEVLAWLAGSPTGANFAGGFPQPLEQAGYADGLPGSLCDVLLLVSPGPAEFWSEDLKAIVRDRLVILLTPDPAEVWQSMPELGVAVVFRTSVSGVSSGGTMFRMDEVPLRMKPIFRDSLPSDESILTAIGIGLADATELSHQRR